MLKNKRIKIIGVPIDLGFGRRGVDMGPYALRIAGITDGLRELGFVVEDTGDILSPIPELCNLEDKKMRYLPEIREVCLKLSNSVSNVLEEGAIPLILGGDHSLAIGSIAGVSRFFKERGKKIGLIWFDAHPDMNTPETTNSGNIHGMPLATSLGFGAKVLVEIGGFDKKVDNKNVAIIGIRIIEDAITSVTKYTNYIHLSFDMDVCDPSIAQGVGTPVKGGLNYREAHLSMEKIAESKCLVSMDMVEINPILDYKNSSAELGVELILSAFGKRIF